MSRSRTRSKTRTVPIISGAIRHGLEIRPLWPEVSGETVCFVLPPLLNAVEAPGTEAVINGQSFRYFLNDKAGEAGWARMAPPPHVPEVLAATCKGLAEDTGDQFALSTAADLLEEYGIGLPAAFLLWVYGLVPADVLGFRAFRIREASKADQRAGNLFEAIAHCWGTELAEAVRGGAYGLPSISLAHTAAVAILCGAAPAALVGERVQCWQDQMIGKWLLRFRECWRVSSGMISFRIVYGDDPAEPPSVVALPDEPKPAPAAPTEAR